MSYLMSLIFLGFTANARIDLTNSFNDREFKDQLQICLMGNLQVKYGPEKAKEKFGKFSYYIESNDPEALKNQRNCLPRVCREFPKTIEDLPSDYKEVLARDGKKNISL